MLRRSPAVTCHPLRAPDSSGIRHAGTFPCVYARTNRRALEAAKNSGGWRMVTSEIQKDSEKVTLMMRAPARKDCRCKRARWRMFACIADIHLHPGGSARISKVSALSLANAGIGSECAKARVRASSACPLSNAAISWPAVPMKTICAHVDRRNTAASVTRDMTPYAHVLPHVPSLHRYREKGRMKDDMQVDGQTLKT